MAHASHPQDSSAPSDSAPSRLHPQQRQQGDPMPQDAALEATDALHRYQFTQQQQQQQPQQLQSQLQQQCREHQQRVQAAECAAEEGEPGAAVPENAPPA